MLNKKSPKKYLNNNIYNQSEEDQLINKIIQTQKVHIRKQVESGASIIQVFDSWAGLIDEEKKINIFTNRQKRLLSMGKA